MRRFKLRYPFYEVPGLDPERWGGIPTYTFSWGSPEGDQTDSYNVLDVDTSALERQIKEVGQAVPWNDLEQDVQIGRDDIFGALSSLTYPSEFLRSKRCRDIISALIECCRRRMWFFPDSSFFPVVLEEELGRVFLDNGVSTFCVSHEVGRFREEIASTHLLSPIPLNSSLHERREYAWHNYSLKVPEMFHFQVNDDEFYGEGVVSERWNINAPCMLQNLEFQR